MNITPEMLDNSYNLFTEPKSPSGEAIVGYDATSGQIVPSLEFTWPDILAIDANLRSENEAQRARNSLDDLGVYLLPNVPLYNAATIDLLFNQKSYSDDISEGETPYLDLYCTTDGNTITGAAARSSLWPAVTYGVAAARAALLTHPSTLVQVGGVQSCFRREAVADLQPGWKQAGFNQANMDAAALLTDELPKSRVDVKAISTAIRFLEASGIPQASMQLRLNNPAGILYPILQQQGIVFEEGIAGLGWECLNEMAAARANDQIDRALANRAAQLVEKWNEAGSLSPPAKQFLETLVQTGEYDVEIMRCDFPAAYQTLTDLEAVVAEISRNYPVIAVQIDPLSTRSGYDGTTCQFDIRTQTGVLAEIGGGGAYQRRAQNSWSMQFEEPAPPNFYMVGVAFGLSRVETVRAILNRESNE